MSSGEQRIVDIVLRELSKRRDVGADLLAIQPTPLYKLRQALAAKIAPELEAAVAHVWEEVTFVKGTREAWRADAIANADRVQALRSELARVSAERDSLKECEFSVRGRALAAEAKLRRSDVERGRLRAALEAIEDVARAAISWAPEGSTQVTLRERLEDALRLPSDEGTYDTTTPGLADGSATRLLSGREETRHAGSTPAPGTEGDAGGLSDSRNGEQSGDREASGAGSPSLGKETPR